MRSVYLATACAVAMFLSAVAEGGTWTASFLARGGVDDFDAISVSMSSGAGFADPALSNFDVGGWQLDPGSTAVSASASGSLTNNLAFDVTFNSDQSTPVAFTFDGFGANGTLLLEHTIASWSGGDAGAWSFNYVQTPAGGDVIEVPTPASASMGLTLMGLLGGIGYLRKRRLA